mgnify:CR=1 FL=1
MAANIQAYLENLQQPWGQIYYDILFDQLQDIKGKRVLDFGSGFGLVANHLAQENQVLAVEPNEEMVALRPQNHPYQQLVGSLDQLESFEDASLMSFSATMSRVCRESQGCSQGIHPPLETRRPALYRQAQ